jgi:protein-L-isoaspartate(D-aspartate) O-methyltransferase
VITKNIGVQPLSSSTAPSLMASMLEILNIKSGMKVLEVGTGTGYNAAIIAELIGDQPKVFTVDIDNETTEEAKRNLGNAGYKNINVKCVDGYKGLPEESPFDRIIITASVRDIPKPLIEQLKEGKIIVAPILINGTQITPALQKQKDGSLISISTVIGGFMQLRSKTLKEMLKNLQGKTSEKELLISTEYPELFDKEKLELLLNGPFERKSQFIEGILSPRASNFFPFLALKEKKSVELFLEGDVNKFGFGDSAAGIIDLENKSACLISRDDKLYIYGSLSAYEKILLRAEEWKRLKKPGVDRFQVFVYRLDQKPRLEKDDLIFTRNSHVIVVRIKVSR